MPFARISHHPVSPVRWLASALLALVWLLIVPSSHAENLNDIQQGQLPDIHAQLLMDFSDQTVASDGRQLYQIKKGQDRWQPLQLPPQLPAASLVAAAQGSNQQWLLQDSRQGALRLLHVHLKNNQLDIVKAHTLPSPLLHPVLGTSDDELLVAGQDRDGQNLLFALNGKGQWHRLSAWEEAQRPIAIATRRGAIYLALENNTLLRFSTDSGWQQQPSAGGTIIAGSLRPLGQAHLMALVDEGSKTVLRSFHTITGAWNTIDVLPQGAVTAAAPRGNGMVWAQGRHVAWTDMIGGKHLLRTLDWVVIALYLGAMLGMGLWFYLRDQNSSTADYFVGGRSIPFWVAGISLYATNTSSISFIAIPAKAFDTNWQYLTNNLMAVLGLVFVAIWIVPLLRRLNLMSVFSYLETRFHPAIRMLSSALCIVMQIGSRMSVILFLPALAISTITGLDVIWSILMMGVFTIIYSTIGGSKAVIWTDVVQVFVMFGGALFAIGFIIWQSGADLPHLMSAVAAEDKTRIFDFSFDLTKATVWGFLFLVLFDVVLTFPKDQVLMQRALSTTDDKAAGRSIWAFAAIMIPGGFVFYGIGTALWMYYRNNPERLNPLLPIDATFPLFIAAELPAGVTGLIIAGIFAAAMSTLSSIINSVGTLVSVDFYQKLHRHPNEKTAVRVAEWSGIVVGLIGIAIALVMSRYDINSLFDVSIELAGLLGGGFAGAYTLGMFTTRANWQGVVIGVVSSIAITVTCWVMDLVHPYFYLAISIALCIVFGYAASFLFPAPSQSLDGLTIHSSKPAAKNN